jgi:exportin-7
MASDTTPDIFELEKLCEQLYNSNSAQQIQNANKILESFSNSNDCLSKCQILLDRGVVCKTNTIFSITAAS